MKKPRSTGDSCPRWLKPYMNYRQNSESLARLKTKDGLIRTNELVVRRLGSRRYEFYLSNAPHIQVFPASPATEVTYRLVRDPGLWSMAAIELVAAPSILGRFTIYGVPFQRAVEIVASQRFHKAKFQVQLPDRLEGQGAVAELVVHVGRENEKDTNYVTLEAWQDVGQSTEVFYVHARMLEGAETFEHLDGATMHFDPADKAFLFEKGRKLKGYGYQKHFRLDGVLPIHSAIKVVKSYFPIEELADEFFLAEKR